MLIDLEHYVATTVNTVENQLPTPVTNSTLTAVGNKCFVFGGTDLKGACYNDIRALDVGESAVHIVLFVLYQFLV